MIDRKTLRTSARAGAVDCHLRSALHQRLGIVLAQVTCLDREVVCKRTGGVTRETRYAVLSLGPERATPQQVLTIWRESRHGENRLHWVRDVTFGEDASRIRGGHAPQVMAA